MQTLRQDHKVLGEEYCSGYMDAFGKWNTGFPCPPGSSGEDPVYCCGNNAFKYCCVKPTNSISQSGPQRKNSVGENSLSSQSFSQDSPSLALLLGVTSGVVIAVVVVVVVSCLRCSCCILYRKRNYANRGAGGLYRPQLSHSPHSIGRPAGGDPTYSSYVGNITPSDISRSLSSRSQTTLASIPGAPYTQLDHNYLTPVGVDGLDRGFMGANVGGSGPNSTVRPGSMTISEHSSSSLSDISSTIRSGRNLVMDPPPPYSAPNCSLVVVRAPPRPHTPPSLRGTNKEALISVGNGTTNNGVRLGGAYNRGSYLSTFSQPITEQQSMALPRSSALISNSSHFATAAALRGFRPGERPTFRPHEGYRGLRNEGPINTYSGGPLNGPLTSYTRGTTSSATVLRSKELDNSSAQLLATKF